MHDRAELCGGGRTRAIRIYRERLERHGKPCLFVESPSRSALERALSGYNEPLRAAPREAQADKAP